MIDGLSAWERTLTNIGRNVGAGVEMRLADRLSVMTAYAASMRASYGPGPMDMQTHLPDIPENVKGVLAAYVG